MYRSDWGRIVATLIRQFGDFELAEDAAQDAFTAAVDQWRTDGIPESPRAWIIQTAKHKIIDRLRRQTRLQQKLEADPDFSSEPIVDGPNLNFDEIPDDRWREICSAMSDAYRAGRFEAGTLAAIERIDRLLAAAFPREAGTTDVDELPNRPLVL